MILQAEGALSRDLCHKLMSIYDRYCAVAARRDPKGRPVLYCHQSEIDPDARAQVTRAIDECQGMLVDGLRLSDPIHPETALLTAIGAGGHIPLHADNRRIDEHGRWIANHTPQRDYSVLAYLNDDFEGGELVFENQGVAIRPKTGLVVAFPSSQDYLHAVRPVKSGSRYSMPMWFTRDPSFAMSELISAGITAPG
jgi:hypothetical protein